MKVRPATASDLDRIMAVGLRSADRVETMRLGIDPDTVLYNSFAISDFCAALAGEGGAIAVGGVARKSLIGDIGLIWMLGTPEIEDNPTAFLRSTKAFLQRVQKEYASLENIVDADNYRTIRWLRWLGFEFDANPVITPLGYPFWRFRRERNV